MDKEKLDKVAQERYGKRFDDLCSARKQVIIDLVYRR